MNKLLGALALSALLATAAPAATLTFTLNSPAGNFTKTYTIPDAHMARFYTAVSANYLTPIVTGTDAQGNAITRPPTRAEVLTRLFDGLMKGWRDSVLQSERMEAANAAATPITPITIPTIDATP